MFVSERHPYNCKLCNNQLHKKKLNHYRAVNPPHLKILSHDAQHMTSFILYKNTHWLWSSQMVAMTQSARKRCCWHCSIWPDWFTSHQSHYCLYQKCHIPEFTRKCSNLISLLESRVYKKRQTLAIVWELDFRL